MGARVPACAATNLGGPVSDQRPARPAAERREPADASAAALRLKERIYATITMVAVTVGLSVGAESSIPAAASAVAVTALGLWLATVVADQQAHRVVHLRDPSSTEIRRLLFVSSPLLVSALPALAMITLSAFGVVALRTALLIAAGVGVGSLFMWSYLGGRRMGNGPAGAAIAGTVDMTIGVAVALVKYVAGH